MKPAPSEHRCLRHPPSVLRVYVYPFATGPTSAALLRPRPSPGGQLKLCRVVPFTTSLLLAAVVLRNGHGIEGRRTLSQFDCGHDRSNGPLHRPGGYLKTPAALYYKRASPPKKRRGLAGYDKIATAMRCSAVDHIAPAKIGNRRDGYMTAQTPLPTCKGRRRRVRRFFRKRSCEAPPPADV